MGMLLERLQNALAYWNLLPKEGSDEVDLKKRIALFHQKLTVGMLFGITRTAVGRYLRSVEIKRDPGLLDIIASKETSFVFPWLVSLGVLEDTINDLLKDGTFGISPTEPETDEKPDNSSPDDGIDPELFGPNHDG